MILTPDMYVRSRIRSCLSPDSGVLAVHKVSHSSAAEASLLRAREYS